MGVTLRSPNGLSTERPRRRPAWLVAAALLCAFACGCATTRVVDREKIASDVMQFDGDRTVTFLRGKVEAAREGSLGGYGGAAAGGCGCQ